MKYGVTLAAIALATQHIRIGPLVTPLPRRRPVKLARETVSLDHLSGGRLVLGVGIGLGPWEWDYFGEETNPRTRAAMLDEGLELLTKLWTGEPVLHEGRFYRYRGDLGPGRPDVNPTPLLPRPLQSPRIPIWVAGTWPTSKRPFRRAARWDGVVPLGPNSDTGSRLTPADVRDMLAYIRLHRTEDGPFDAVIGGETESPDRPHDLATVESYRDAGAVVARGREPWRFGWNWQGPWPFAAMRERIRRGPARVG